MKSISQKLQDDIRDIMEGNIKHPNQQKIDVHEPEKDEITADDFKKLRAMKKTKTGSIFIWTLRTVITMSGYV